MGLKALVLEDLKLRGINRWTKKAPVGKPNRKQVTKLNKRREAFDRMDTKMQASRTRPGSSNPKKRP